MFLGPEELDFLVLFSHPPLNRVLPMRDILRRSSLFLPVVLKPCGCRNKVCDLKKVVTCFLGYLTGCVLASCSDLCGGWEGEWFSSGIPQYSPSRTFGLGRARQGFQAF